MNIKSITLSAKEIDQLLSIDDPEERLKTRQFVAKAMAEPESIHAADYLNDSKSIYVVARRIERRVKAATRRRERQATKPAAQASPDKTTSSVPNTSSFLRSTSSIINVFATNGTVHSFHQSTQLMLRAVEIMLRHHAKYSSIGESDPVCDYLKGFYDRLQAVQDSVKFKSRPDLSRNICCISFMPL